MERDETLYRMIKRSWPDTMGNGRPTSALFKDENGVSVDRDGGRSEKEVEGAFRARFKRSFKGLVSVGADVCLDNAMAVIPETEYSKFHAAIYDDDRKTPLRSVCALMLADAAKVVVYDRNVQWTGSTSL